MLNITAVITAFNRPEKLSLCYRSLRKHYPALPVVVVDTGNRFSDLPEDDPLLSYRRRGDIYSNVSAARNAGIGEAATPYVALVDDDYEFIHGDGLPAMIDVLESGSADVAAGVLCNEVAGEWRPIYCAHDLATVGTDLMQYAPGQPEQVTPSGTRYQPCQLTWCYLLAKRETFIRLPWHEALPCGIECFDWFLSAARAGLRLAMVPDATVRHHPGGDEAYTERRSGYQSHLSLLRKRWGVDRIKQTSATKPADAMIREPKPLAKPKPRRTGPVRAGLLIPGLGLGGAEICAAMLVQHCDPARLQWHGVVNANGNPPRPEIVERIACPILPAADARELARQCDVLITWGLPNLGELLVPKPPCRIVLVSHGSCGWTRGMLQRAKPYATHLAAVSLAAARAMGESRWVEILPNGCDVARLEPVEHRDATRTRWGVQPDERLVGYLGRLSAEKAPLACVRAAVALGEPWRPVLIGGGPHADRWRDEALRLHPRAICLEPISNVGDALRALDCFVLASPHEGMSLALLEAWACGVPTVCTPVGAVPELEDLHGPLTVPVPVNATDQQLAEAVQDAYGPNDGWKIVEHAKATVLRRYTAKAMAQRWTNYLEGICR